MLTLFSPPDVKDKKEAGRASYNKEHVIKVVNALEKGKPDNLELKLRLETLEKKRLKQKKYINKLKRRLSNVQNCNCTPLHTELHKQMGEIPNRYIHKSIMKKLNVKNNNDPHSFGRILNKMRAARREYSKIINEIKRLNKIVNPKPRNRGQRKKEVVYSS